MRLLKIIPFLLVTLLSVCQYAPAQSVANDTPIRYVASLPTVCRPSDKKQSLVYKYTATSGLYYCSAANTWTAVASGGGSSASLSATYSNSLATAISAIGATKTTLLVDADTTCSTALTVPSTLILRIAGKSQITKAASCTIAFQGIGLENPLSQDPVFTSFTAGDITWTGSTYPAVISAKLWNSADVMANVHQADSAFLAKKVTIKAFPGDFATTVTTLTSGHNLYFTKGDYTSSVATLNATLMWLESDTHVYGDGQTATKLHGPTAVSCDRIFGVSGMNSIGQDGYNENIEISDLELVNDDATKSYPDTGAAAILLGNCTNCHVRRVTIKDYPAYGVYIGGFPSQKKTFTDGSITIGTGNIAITAHGRSTGDATTISTTGVFPTPTAGQTDLDTLYHGRTYWIIKVDANNIKLAQSKANALAGTAITYSSAAGGGTHSIDGFQPNASSIEDNVFDNVRGQNVGFLNGKNITISRNLIINPQLDKSAANITLIDIEPNSDDEICEDLAIINNTIDSRSAQQAHNGLLVQAGGNTNGCVRGIISGNIITGPTNSRLSAGITVSGTSGFLVYGNNVSHTGQTGLVVYASRTATVQNNILEQTGGNDAAMRVYNTANSVFDGNKVIDDRPGGAAVASRLIEDETTWEINSTGTTVERKSNGTFSGSVFLGFFAGLNVNINGSTYAINTITSSSVITTTSSVGTLVFKTLASGTDINTGTDTFTSTAHGFANGCKLRYQAGSGAIGGLTDGTDYYVVSTAANTFKLSATLGGAAIDITTTGTGNQLFHPVMTSIFSSNEYTNNRIPQGITLNSAGTSRIPSDSQKVKRDSYAPAQITVDQNDYKPTIPYAYRFDLSTSASKNITGWASVAAFPDYYVPQDGEEHLLYNAGSNDFVLKHENASSVATGRFHNSTAADITVSTGQAAKIVYNGTLLRWMVFKWN
jgi:hypothetical protein